MEHEEQGHLAAPSGQVPLASSEDAPRPVTSATPTEQEAPSQHGIKITRAMLEELLALTAPGDHEDEPVEVTLRQMDDGPEGPGLYAWYPDYPEEGVVLIDGKSEVLRAEGRASVHA